ncbi:MAG: Rne/Rng family ribonuclease [Pegethrix bostrychoides GSE-TBD4-15B]|jgi:ribonuclease E|uniref:Rne/Rng family ribonuclease n=1 Tax=Pegethrix bostrychoides GSE-TBD4-15B TaxID=2839662 RepID=A0A951PGS6_9CYAN|nr:Rne/Rng family ribonuclease [Pegethrix bostrychoides GSE-TBD4-15B]
MSKQIIIAEQHRIAAVFSEDQIQELIVAKGTHQVSDIYLGIVENVLPGIDAAFVNIGDSDRNGFIHVTDLGPLRLKKSAGSITELLAPQQRVLVQIMKEPTGNKGPRLTGNVSLPGRYLVLMPFGRGVNLSRRIRSEAERNRLRALAILVKPSGMGLLVRTEAEDVPEEAIIEDLETLQKQWENIQQEATTVRPPSLLNRDDDFIQRVLRDVYSADVNRIVVDSHTGLKRVKQHLSLWSSGKAPQGVLVDHHRERSSILEYFRVNAAIREALKPRVDLPSGGYIIIERTEALTVIDVNSGSFTRSATARETVLWTNCEAATEIARQLRLRNIAGVIVVDFIDMDARRDQLQVLEQFNKSLRSDKARPQIAQLTELGLVELTRKRQGQNIYELFGQTCPTCGGMGLLVHLPGELDQELPEPLEARSIPAREARETRETWETSGDEFDTDASSDLQELDLTNHPNYQERGRGGNRRRRRDPRMKVGEPALKTVIPKIESKGDLEDEAETATIEELSTTPIRLPKESRSDKPERGRSGRREKQPAEPPQVISVEMTPEEQDVYALMGISPLLLSAESVKDPKSAIIAITTPGQAPRILAERQPPVEAEPLEVEPLEAEPFAEQSFEEAEDEDDREDNPEDDQEFEPAFEPTIKTRELSVAPPIRRSDLDNAAAALSELLPEAPNGAESDSEPEAGETQNEVRRRRRRRSSTAP